jgi:large-conductance mechanosensitive channel
MSDTVTAWSCRSIETRGVHTMHVQVQAWWIAIALTVGFLLVAVVVIYLARTVDKIDHAHEEREHDERGERTP